MELLLAFLQRAAPKQSSCFPVAKLGRESRALAPATIYERVPELPPPPGDFARAGRAPRCSAIGVRQTAANPEGGQGASSMMPPRETLCHGRHSLEPGSVAGGGRGVNGAPGAALADPTLQGCCSWFAASLSPSDSSSVTLPHRLSSGLHDPLSHTHLRC